MRTKFNVGKMLLVFTLVFCMVWANPSTSLAAALPLQAGGVVQDDIPTANGGLSTAKNFHIFSNEAELHVHTNGNVATGNLIGNVNFGTNVHGGQVAKDIHYLQSITCIAGSSFVDSSPTRGLKVVFGAGVNLSLTDNNNKLVAEETKLDHIKLNVTPPEAYSDRNGQKYIDFPTVFDELRAESNALAGNAQTPGVHINFNDQNNRVVDVTNANVPATGTVKLTKKVENSAQVLPDAIFDLYKVGTQAPIRTNLKTDANGVITVNGLEKGSYYFREKQAPDGYVIMQQDTSFQLTDANVSSSGYIYVTLTKAQLERANPITIKGLGENRPSVIINVEMQGSKSLHFNSQITLIIDGQERNSTETEDFSDAKILWNFPNSTENIYVDRCLQGTILATGAYVEANQNVDGSIIADKVNIKSGESHRWDFQTTAATAGTPVEVTVTNRLKTVDLKVTKKWQNAAGQDITNTMGDGINVVVELLSKQNGQWVSENKTVTLNKGNNWTNTFTGLAPDKEYGIHEQGETGLIAAVGGELYHVQYGTITDHEVLVTNKKGAAGVWKPTVTKKLTGKTLEQGAFTFELKEGPRSLQTVTNDATGNIPFAAINYTIADIGDHTYTITEVKPTPEAEGMTYDNLVVTYHVRVSDNGNGTLKAEPIEPMPEDTQFDNAYAAVGSWAPTVTKKLTGKTLEQGAFTFELKEGTQSLQTVTNDAAGNIPFAAINYTIADIGDHTYTITEKNNSLPGITYDTMTVTYNVRVTDKGDGTLEATLVTTPTDTQFDNAYAAAGVWKPTVTKNLTGRTLLDNEFEFELKEGANVLQSVKNKEDGSVPFEEIKYTAAGNHTYTITEKNNSLPGVTYDTMTVTYNVTVTDKGDGTLEVTVPTPPADTQFDNAYAAAGVWKPTVKKNLTGRALAANEFEFELKEDTTVLQSVKNKADGSVPFEEIKYTAAGNHTYTITEKNNSLPGVTYDTMTVTYNVRVTDKGDGTLVTTPTDTQFDNAYAAAGVWKPTVTKNLTGRALAANEFEFELKEGANVLQSVKNKEDGTVPFEEIKYTAAGNHTYTITEKNNSLPGVTYDTMTVTYNVTVTDKGDGTLEVTVPTLPADTQFDNAYAAAGVWKPTVTKNLTGRTLLDNEFEFELKEGANVLQSVKNKEDGSVPFEEIKYTAAGNHTYTITEKNNSLPGVTYDTMTVTYKGDGTLEVTVPTPPADTQFDNAYAAAGVWKPTVTKNLTGRALAEGEFEFELKEGANVLQSVKNKEDGTVPFEEIKYTAAGNHTYTITEKNNSLPGVTYDTMTVTYNVTVTDKGDGTLEVTVPTPPADTQFDNAYAAAGVWKPTVTKNLTGRALAEGEFEFELKEKGITLQKVKNNADGSIPFVAIDYKMTDVGLHTYTITEAVPASAEPGMTYDTMVVTYNVRVTDKGDGTLEATLVTTPTDTQFDNTYTTTYDAISVPLTATKKLVNGALKAGQFTFELLSGDHHVIETVSNDASRMVRFTDRSFSEEGTFIYTVREVKGDNAKITYDGTVYRAIIRVTASGGKLVAKVDYEKNGIPYDGDIKFINRVEMPKTGDTRLLLPAYLIAMSLMMLGGAVLIKRKQAYRR